jgi:hypothetical protein
MKNRLIVFVSTLTLIFTLGSCLKDDVGEYWPDGVAGKMYATVVKATLQQLALQPVAGDVNFEFLVNIATDALPTEDITVTFKIDPAAVTTYNTDFSKSFKPYPNVQLLTQSITIAKGTRNGYAKGKVWGAESLNACDNYIAAISIESAKTASGKDVPVAGNMKTYLLALPIANPYAGNYRNLGYRIHPSYTDPLAVDKTVTCSTVDCKTISKFQMGDYTTYNCYIEITSATMVVNGKTVYKVNVSSPDVAKENWVQYTTFTGSSTTTPVPPSNDVNYYDPSTKTFVLNYAYLSSGVARKIYEVVTRL